MTARKKALEQFQNDPPTTVFLLSVRAGAVGLTLTAATHVFLLEPCLNVALELQAVNRVHRIGQTKEVHVKYLVMKDSVEERIMDLNKDKRNAANSGAAAAAGSQADAPGAVSEAQLAFELSEAGLNLPMCCSHHIKLAKQRLRQAQNAAKEKARIAAMKSSIANQGAGHLQKDNYKLRLSELEQLFF